MSSTSVHRRVGTSEAYSGHCFAALMKERRENGVRVEKIVELQVKVAQWNKLLCINSQDAASLNFPQIREQMCFETNFQSSNFGPC